MTSHDLLHTYSLVLPERAELEQDVSLATQDYYNTYIHCIRICTLQYITRLPCHMMSHDIRTLAYHCDVHAYLFTAHLSIFVDHCQQPIPPPRPISTCVPCQSFASSSGLFVTWMVLHQPSPFPHKTQERK